MTATPATTKSWLSAPFMGRRATGVLHAHRDFAGAAEYKLPITKYIWNTLAMKCRWRHPSWSRSSRTAAQSSPTEATTHCWSMTVEYCIPPPSPAYGQGGRHLQTAAEAAKKRWENQPCKVSDGSEDSNEDANAEQKVSKEKERKEKPKQSKARVKQRKERKRDYLLRPSPEKMRRGWPPFAASEEMRVDQSP